MSISATATDQLWFLNTLVTVRVSDDEGQGGISVLESVAPYGDSPPLHIHETEDETFYVLDGELRLRAGDADVRLRRASACSRPRAWRTRTAFSPPRGRAGS